MSGFYIKIKGIQCEHCVAMITQAIHSQFPTAQVSITRNIAHLTAPNTIDKNTLVKAICDSGYVTKTAWISSKKPAASSIQFAKIALVCALVFTAHALLKRALGFDIFLLIPTIDSTRSLGMLFLIGVFTSLHCVSMCGAINLSASLSTQTTHSRFRALSKPLLYNLGRLISYSVLGAVIGALGKAVSLSPVLSAVLLLVSASIMFLMALSFLRVIDFHLPALFARIPLPKKISAQNAYLSSLLVGLLNGFMPCGPLQALQIYALGTGSAFLGMSALFLFCLGTIPLMLALGVFSTVARGAVKARLTSISAILILVLSISMLSRAVTSLGIRLPEIQLLENASKQPLVAHMDESEAFQTVSFDLDYSEYADIQVKKGIPVRLIITADEDVITGCNNEIICPKLNFSQKLIPGENIIEFTPERTGTFVYSCWMNMIKNTIKVVE